MNELPNTNKYASYCQTDKPNSKWESSNAREIQAYAGCMNLHVCEELRMQFLRSET